MELPKYFIVQKYSITSHSILNFMLLTRSKFTPEFKSLILKNNLNIWEKCYY